MKSQKEIEKILDNLPIKTKYPQLIYEDGVWAALEWVLGKIKNEDFEYSKEKK